MVVVVVVVVVVVDVVVVVVEILVNSSVAEEVDAEEVDRVVVTGSVFVARRVVVGVIVRAGSVRRLGVTVGKVVVLSSDTKFLFSHSIKSQIFGSLVFGLDCSPADTLLTLWILMFPKRSGANSG